MLGQFSRCLDGYKDLIDRQSKHQDQLNHILGNYIALGVNAPKKYPKKPLLQEEKKTEYTPLSFEQIAKQRYGKK